MKLLNELLRRGRFLQVHQEPDQLAVHSRIFGGILSGQLPAQFRQLIGSRLRMLKRELCHSQQIQEVLIVEISLHEFSAAVQDRLGGFRRRVDGQQSDRAIQKDSRSLRAQNGQLPLQARQSLEHSRGPRPRAGPATPAAASVGRSAAAGWREPMPRRRRTVRQSRFQRASRSGVIECPGQHEYPSSMPPWLAAPVPDRATIE